MDQEKQDRLIEEAKRQAKKGVTHPGQLISLGAAWHAGKLWQATGRRGKNRDTGRLDEEVETLDGTQRGWICANGRIRID